MNVQERIISTITNSRYTPMTAPQIHDEMDASRPSYPALLHYINELVHKGKLTESRNVVDKRVFSVKG